MALLLISAPSNAGPGEREQMLDGAAQQFSRAGLERGQVLRIDVPGRGAGEDGDGALRTELEPSSPCCNQAAFSASHRVCSSLTQNLQASESAVLEELIKTADLTTIEVVILAAGAVPRSLSALVKSLGESQTVRKMWERQAMQWLGAEVRDRGLILREGGGEALLQKFGSDTAAMGQALDQLEQTSGKITKEVVLDRFKNRPDEPTFLITDAMSKGEVGEALRRLSDFLVHGHPLVFLAAVESDLKKRALAATARMSRRFGNGSVPRRATGAWPVLVSAGKGPESSLRRAQEALVGQIG